MKYLTSDIRKLYSNQIIRIMLIFFLLVMIADPLYIRFVEGLRYSNFFTDIGKHPFQFWMLMFSSGWGNGIYYTFFFLFSVFSTGLLFYQERSSSMYAWLITRKNYKSYMLSKIFSVFITTLFNFFILLSINLLVTWCVFSTEAPLTEQYRFSVPQSYMFAYDLYQISPLCMAVFYTFFNALAIALYAVFALAIHMIFQMRNIYFAILVPFIIMYGASYANALLLYEHSQYNIRILLQPKAANAFIYPFTWEAVGVVLGFHLLVDLILVGIGIRQNKELL